MLQQRIYGVVKTVDDLAGAQLNLTKVTKVRLLENLLNWLTHQLENHIIANW